VNEQPQPSLGDLVPLLARARRRYHAATRLGHTALASRYERSYNKLFEQRRRALLAQAAHLAKPMQPTQAAQHKRLT
jgi:hypothetical protein